MAASCLACLPEAGSDDFFNADTIGLWSVKIVKGPPYRKYRKWIMAELMVKSCILLFWFFESTAEISEGFPRVSCLLFQDCPYSIVRGVTG